MTTEKTVILFKKGLISENLADLNSFVIKCIILMILSSSEINLRFCNKPH